MSIICFVLLKFLAAHNKTLVWNPVPEQHIAYWTVEMQGSPTLWFRLGTTNDARFVLPTGPYVRTFRVKATVESYWPFPNPPPSAPITTHL